MKIKIADSCVYLVNPSLTHVQNARGVLDTQFAGASLDQNGETWLVVGVEATDEVATQVAEAVRVDHARYQARQAQFEADAYDVAEAVCWAPVADRRRELVEEMVASDILGLMVAERDQGFAVECLLSRCLDGADDDRVGGWRAYVSEVARLADVEA